MDDSRPKINDLNLRVVLIRLKQYVLWLQVSVYHSIDVHIVDSHEQLLHEDSRLFLPELSSVYNIVIEFPTLADLCDNVHVLLVLKDLVHLHHVGVVQMLQYLDLVPLDLLLVLTHSGGLQDLNCSLSAKLSVDAHTNLTKGA